MASTPIAPQPQATPSRIRRGRWHWRLRSDAPAVVSDWIGLINDIFSRERSDVRPLKRGDTTDVAGLGTPPALLAKRYNLCKPLTPLKDFFRGSRAYRAFVQGLRLEHRGIATARVEAYGVQRIGGLPVRSCLLTQFIDNAENLMHVLNEGPEDLLQSAIRPTARLVARLHQQGFSHRDLKADNFMIRPPADGDKAATVHLIDLDGLCYRRWVSRHRRNKDLRRLKRSFHEAGQGEGLAWDQFLDAYQNALPQMKVFRDTRSTLIVHPAYLAALREAGITRVADLAALDRDATYRDMPGRTTYRVQINRGDHAIPGYIKRSRQPSWFHRLLQPWQPGAAFNEWRQLNQLQQAGLPAPQPIAYGRHTPTDGPAEDMVLMSELTGANHGEDFVKFHGDNLRHQPVQRRRLIKQLADLARRFHQAGFHHQDFYLCHFWFLATGSDSYDIFILDHHRTNRPLLLRRRWLVKDIGQLHASAPALLVTRTDRVRFLHVYFGVNRLSAQHKRFARAADRKARQIHRHTPRHAFDQTTVPAG